MTRLRLMTRLRRALGPVVGIWLVCQIAPLMVAPAAFWVADQLACTCPRGAGGACPMHKQTASTTPCLIRSVDDTGTAVLSALLGPVGLVPVPTLPVAPVVIEPSSPGEPAPVTDRPRPPEPPPPRS
jgi:hypothetical protein